MKKQLLTIILLCALTLTGFTALSTVHVNAATTDADILSYSWYVAPTSDMATYAGDLVAVGELQNVGTTNIGYAYVTGYAYVNETEVAIAQRQVYGNNLQPGQKAPFYLDFQPDDSITGDLSWVANVTDVAVYVSYVYNTDLDMYQGLTVSSQGAIDNSGVYTVIGSVENTGSETIGDVRVVTTFYNTNGTVVSLNYTEVLSDSLAPGSSKTFVAIPVDSFPGDEITSYAVMAQSTIQMPDTTTSPTSTPTPTSTPSATATPTSTSTQTANQSNQDYTLIIGAAIVLVVVIIAVVVLLTRGKHSKTEPSA
ncbi:MAG: FxLYD domain-containing protein [Candidatus Bathyarchaeia archaeon]